jgi:hypothetical protein
MQTKIIIDSTADLIPELKARTAVVPLTVHFGEEEYIDGVTITHPQFYEKLVETDMLPRTSQAGPAAFAKAYKAAAAEGCEAVVLTLSEKLSGTYQSAIIAAQDYDNVVVVTDRDDDDTEKMMLGRLSATLDEGGARGEFALACGEWSQYVVKTRLGLEVPFRMNVLFVPTEGNGAMETFLLDAVGRRDPYDGAIVARCKDFVDGADPEGRYLTKRGYVTKAVFDAFFSIRTTVDQFAERQRVLLSVDWENYAAVNEGFSVLAEL